MADVELRAERREVLGKKVRFLRRKGLVPANLYGPGLDSMALQLPAKATELALRRISSSTLVPLAVEGEPTRRVLVRDIQRHPTGEQVLHLDLFAVSMSETMRTAVSLHFLGEAPAVAQFDGTLLHNVDSVEVEALPSDLPPRIPVDLSALDTLQAVIHASDLTIPDKVTLLTPPETVIVSVAPPRLAAEETPTEAAAEAPAEAAAATPAAAEPTEETTE